MRAPSSSAASRSDSQSSLVHTSSWRRASQAPTRLSVADVPHSLTRATFRSMASRVENRIDAGSPSPVSMVDSATRPRIPVSSAALAIWLGCGPPASAKQVVPTRSALAYASWPDR